MTAAPDRALQQQTNGNAAHAAVGANRMLKNAPAMSRCEWIRGSIQVEEK
jgi:hypothetical protein